MPIGGCIASDADFDGTSYQPVWPGTDPNRGQDAKYHPTAVTFTSPLFNGTQNYSRVAFETDLPRIEAPDSGGICDRFTGNNCVNPPPGSNFYPIYTTGSSTQNPSANGHCVWQFGGPYLKGTTNTFGGNSAAEYGPLLFSFYPNPNPAIRLRTNNFRNVLELESLSGLTRTGQPSKSALRGALRLSADPRVVREVALGEAPPGPVTCSAEPRLRSRLRPFAAPNRVAAALELDAVAAGASPWSRPRSAVAREDESKAFRRPRATGSRATDRRRRRNHHDARQHPTLRLRLSSARRRPSRWRRRRGSAGRG